ncbi:MAG TPA: DNA primase [Candidatus Limnocylindrales bacterium]|nr:DNA primase [Candidatus Limnocylindrales bacterium]HEX5040005.1 DNA primase [Candidatus Limnocylindria bacterium]
MTKHLTSAPPVREGIRISSPSGIVAEIKSKLPVAEVVGETVPLKRAGTLLKGLCPFHAEKTPSFTVTPERESWHCFGCGEHGDIFTFVMRRDGLDFKEALARLAERAGVELSQRDAGEDRRRRRLREALESAIAWYREVLLQAHQAERARAYLAERGLTDETLDRFGIGYAPKTWDAMTKRLRAKGFTDGDLTDAGLAKPSNRGGVYDAFRGRIIIPIRDASGRPIGLGGRILPDAEGPKYLNSPATALFDKSRTLYGIDLAKTAIRREKLAVIVEGYTDVMAAHQAGFANVVASLGTALTAGQVELANRYADAVALAYDVDLAGEAATQRGLLEELGPVVSKVRVIRIPAGKDPDELIRTDPDGWRTAVEAAEELLPYFMQRAASEVDMRQPHGRSAYTRRMLDLLRRIPDRVERDSYVPGLAQLAGIDERVLRDELARGPRPLPIRPVDAGPLAEAPVLNALEREALTLLLLNPGLAEEQRGTDLPLRDSSARALAEAWIAAATGPDRPELEAFVGGLDAGTAELARSVLASARARGVRPDTETDRAALRVCFLRLRKEQVQERLTDLQTLISVGARDEASTDIHDLERQFQVLHLEREQLEQAINPSAALVGERRT